MRTIKTYVGEVGRTVYPVDFGLGYLDRSHVYVYAGDTPTNQLAYSWPNANQIELTTPFTEGAEFKIRRITPRHELFNDYENGAILEERNLDDSFKQTLMVLEEWEDGSYPDGLTMLNDLDMNGNRILNLPKPLLPHEPLRLQDVNIDVSLIVPDSELALIRSTIEPTPLNGKFWFNKVDKLCVGDDGEWKDVSGEGGGTGGGIVYASELPEEKVAGTTYFDADKLESVYTYDDGDSVQYLAIPLLAGGIGTDSSGGGGGGTSTFTTASANGVSLVATTSNPENHRVKSLIAGTGLKTTTTGTEVTLNVDLTNTASITGQSLLVDTDGSVTAKKQIKKVRAGSNITLSSDEESITISSTGGGGGGGGIAYAETLPEVKVEGATYFDHAKAELITTYNDGDSLQYLAYPMSGYGAVGGSGGGGSDFTFVQLGTVTDGSTFFSTNGLNTYSWKRIKAGDSATTRITDNGTSIVVDALDVVAPTVAGTSLVGIKTPTTQPIKRLVAGTNVTLSETSTTVTINAASGGGATLGDALTRLNTLSPVNNAVPVFTAAGATQFGTTASTRAMMGLDTVGNTIPMFTGSSTATIVSLTPFMVSLIEKTGKPTALAHLGITSGSNANGKWLRVATGDSSGVQICWHAVVVSGATTAFGAGFIGNNASWTYPQAFAETPSVSAEISDGVAASVINGAAGHTSSSASFRQVSFTTSANAAVRTIAVGFY